MYVIKNGTIHTGTGEVLENYDILIEGKKIKKIVCFRESSTGPMQKDKKTGTVTGMYPFVFTVDFGKYTESFRYGQFFEEGSEVVKL